MNITDPRFMLGSTILFGICHSVYRRWNRKIKQVRVKNLLKIDQLYLSSHHRGCEHASRIYNEVWADILFYGFTPAQLELKNGYGELQRVAIKASRRYVATFSFMMREVNSKNSPRMQKELIRLKSEHKKFLQCTGRLRPVFY